jgi:uncharacterized protein
MKLLSVAGTAAMFLVGGGILTHGIPWIEHWATMPARRIDAVAAGGGGSRFAATFVDDAARAGTRHAP